MPSRLTLGKKSLASACAGTYTWSKPVMKGTHPSPRDSHSSMAVGYKLYVFGGTDGTSPLNHTLCFGYCYQHFGDVPAPREGHSASLIGDNLFMFGRSGKSNDPSEEEYYNDLHVLNTNTFVWKKISTTGVSPISRDSHTCSSYKNCFVVMGGEDGGNAYLNDVHILDTEVKTTGAELMPRAGHTTISHGKYLVVFGGFSDDRKLFNDVHTLDLTTGVWATSNPSGPGPSPRFSLAGDSVNAERGILFFYGGCNEELEALDDMYFLDTEMLREKDPSEPKLSMRKELKRRQQEYRATPFMLDKQRDADKSLVSSHGGICGKPWTSPIFPCQTHATEFQAHVQPLGEKMFKAREGKHHRRKPQDVQKAVVKAKPSREESEETMHCAHADLITSGPSKTVAWLGSDWPVVAVNPVGGICSAMERTPSGWSHPWIPEERISAWDAVAGYTSSAVYAAALEDLVGSLTQGKFADFVVLSESHFGQGTGIFPRVIYLRGVGHQDLKLDNILSKLNMCEKVVISTFRRYHNSEVHGS
ncbi:hypothetical protein SELMODRAFT_431919 [Selaginella moellendorffii]|uniref:Amidohydrolase 3 domain-containing protein n=1 Tax=Selaginella moellendorffii TaxID=88036 RepID=D8TED9_SELML|nr:hypothetical protein SELMODRAFT_431919 [Selaginella moellendorffii]